MAARDAWAQDLMAVFKDDVRKVRIAFTASNQNSPQQEKSMSPTHPTQTEKKTYVDVHSHLQSPNQGQGQNAKSHISDKFAGAKHTKLLESSMVFRLEDFTLFRVSTANDKRGGVPKKFLSSEKKQLLLPPEMSSVHMEYTDYYFPEGIDFPGKSLWEFYNMSISCFRILRFVFHGWYFIFYIETIVFNIWNF